MASENQHADWQKWRIVIEAADDLATLAQKGPVAAKTISSILARIEEVFPSTVDPVEELEEYGCRQLCKSLRAALEPQQLTHDRQPDQFI